MPRQAGGSVGLPGYSWDTRLHNYVNESTGRMVARSEITNLLREVTDGAEARLSEYARMAGEQQVTARQFYEAMQQEIKLLTNTNAALAKGGWAQMTQADWGRNGAQLRQEYEHLRQFAAEVEAGTLSAAQIEARAQLYAGKAFSRFWEIDAEQRLASGEYNEEKWNDTNDEAECEDCRKLAQEGWVPIGTLGTVPGAGDTQCLGNCRCEIEYR